MGIKRILAPTDLSSLGEAGVLAAGELARRAGARLMLLHVVPPRELEALTGGHVPAPSMDQISQALQAKVLEQFRRVVPAGVRREISVEALVAVGSPVEEILTTALTREASLIVMGTHVRTVVARLVLESVAKPVLRKAPCPVLTVRPQEAQARLAA